MLQRAAAAYHGVRCVMRRHVAIGVLACFVSGCVYFPPQENLAEVLRDCTEELGGWAGKPASEMPQEQRARVLNAATTWAMKEEYYPCNITLCGAIVDASEKSVSVWITGYGDLNPSATVSFDPTTWRVLQTQFHHSGCPGGTYGPTRHWYERT
jgi:hypothetical protein